VTGLLQVEPECDDFEYRELDARPRPWIALRAEALAGRKPCYSTVSKAVAEKREAESQFQQLTKQWKRETSILGNLSQIVMHPAYQRIMAMGPDVIPLILKEMSREPGHWFWALHNLVPLGEDPAEGTTTIREATRLWLDWGRKKGIL